MVSRFGSTARNRMYQKLTGFFFQAEDGIRDFHVTGVQTCALPISSRGKVGESVKQINDGFPHWLNGAFKQFNKQPERLPFDQHCLIALMAPRPVLLANAVEDTWANPQGQFEMVQAAEPVYRLLKAGGLDAKQMPETGKLVASKLGYYIRPGKHSMTTADWKVFLDFADRQLR